MLLCIDSSVLGTNENLLYDSGEYSWSSSTPKDAWVYGSRAPDKSLDIVLDFLKIAHPRMSFQEYRHTFVELLGEQFTEIPWHAVLPAKKFQQALKEMISILENALHSFQSDQYYGNLMSQRKFLLDLSRAYINVSKLNAYLSTEKNQTVLNTLRSFMPASNFESSSCIYDQCNTVTGRLTVKEGPQILVLPKKYRDIIKSRWRGGKIVQVDFVSLEPRVARLASGRTAASDVYLQLSSEVFNSSLTREQCKLAVLCALYGVSKNRLSEILGTNHDAAAVIERIKDFFGVKELVDSIKPQLKNDSSFRNYFGRKIEPDRDDPSALVNYYVQSSAVDTAILGFIRLQKKIERNSLECIPLFVIHDALVLDVHPSAFTQLSDLVIAGIEIPTLGDFPVTLSTISESKQ